MNCAVRPMVELRTPLWLGAAVLGFAAWWPIGLAILLSFLWSKTMCGGHRLWRWHEHGDERRDGERHGGGRPWRGERRYGRSSGNRAFDDYRNETLRRLEEDQRAFAEYLEQLRRAKDRAEFEQFLAERARRVDGDPAPQA